MSTADIYNSNISVWILMLYNQKYMYHIESHLLNKTLEKEWDSFDVIFFLYTLAWLQTSLVSVTYSLDSWYEVIFNKMNENFHERFFSGQLFLFIHLSFILFLYHSMIHVSNKYWL